MFAGHGYSDVHCKTVTSTPLPRINSTNKSISLSVLRPVDKIIGFLVNSIASIIGVFLTSPLAIFHTSTSS